MMNRIHTILYYNVSEYCCIDIAFYLIKRDHCAALCVCVCMCVCVCVCVHV